MKNFIVFDEFGKILRSGTCSNEDFDNQASNGLSIIEALGNPTTQYIEDGSVVDMPPRPDENYFFNYQSRAWEADVALASLKAMSKRSELLANGPDRINPIWWSSMTQTEKDAWTSYRQALLDVTEQPNYPLQVDWPVKPE